MIRKEFQTEERLFPFVAYFPKKIDGLLPLVVQLHGAGERGNGENDLEKVDIHGFSNMLQGNKEYSCVFVMPQCRKESFWAAEVPNIYKFILNIIDEFAIDTKRIYLTGLSMGGYGTWYTAMRYPEMFAAIAPVCGGGMVWNAAVLDMPIWAFHGTEDELVYPTETLNMIQKIRRNSPTNEVALSMLDNVGHNAWDYAYNEELLKWLLSKSR